MQVPCCIDSGHPSKSSQPYCTCSQSFPAYTSLRFAVHTQRLRKPLISAQNHSTTSSTSLGVFLAALIVLSIQLDIGQPTKVEWQHHPQSREWNSPHHPPKAGYMTTYSVTVETLKAQALHPSYRSDWKESIVPKKEVKAFHERHHKSDVESL